jgi:predicted DNA-binding ribbon-helix-helix protein
MSPNPEDARFHKRSVSLHGHKTSVSLENAFWRVLERAAHDQNISLSQLIKQVDEDRKGALSSALRLYALRIGEN